VVNTLDQTLLDRSCRYGNFNDVAQRTARIYHHMAFGAPQFTTKADMSIYYEALHMIAMKIARLVNGNLNDLDSWRDIAGYAMLVHNQITDEQEGSSGQSPRTGSQENQAKLDKPAPGAFSDLAYLATMERHLDKELSKEEA